MGLSRIFFLFLLIKTRRIRSLANKTSSLDPIEVICPTKCLFVLRFDCMSQSFLESSHAFRYEKGISPEERTSKSTTTTTSTLNDHRKRDIFSLGVLIEEILTSITFDKDDASGQSSKMYPSSHSNGISPI